MSIFRITSIIVIAAAVVYMWRTGQLTRIADYVRQTQEELKKCTWPSWNELKGSTVVVMVSLLLLGGFTVFSDLLFTFALSVITSATTS